MRDKTTWHYLWFKYRVYKPIRSIFEGFRYGYFFSEDLIIESRTRFIERCKNDKRTNK